MKIIFYSPHPTHDIVSEVGYSTHQRETIQAMRNLGHEVIPLIMGGTEKKAVENYHQAISKKSGLKKLILSITPLRLINTLKDLRLIKHDAHAAQLLKKMIVKEKPDLVYERNEFMQDGGVFVCKQAGVKHLLEVNSPVVEEMRVFEGPGFLDFIARKKERNKMQNTSRILAVSNALKDFISKKYQVKNIEVIPNCINPDIQIPVREEIEKIRKNLAWEEAFVFGFVGSIFPYHGVDKMIMAFSELAKSNAQCRLLIVGDGILKQEYEKLAAENLPSGSYKFTGKVPHNDVFRYIGAFDVAMMPDSNWYGSPVKILEYGWMKRPVIAPNLGPVRDLMQNKIHGILVEKGVQALRNAMQFAMENRESMREMGIALRDHIESEFTWDSQVGRVIGWNR